jgi:Carboxypeptidase regulatory-like domain
MLSKSVICGFVCQLLVTLSVSAGTSALEGLVKDPTGRPIKGADVRIEAKDFSRIVKTDANGHYVCDGLGVGTYRITLVINGQVKASILNAKTQLNKPTQLNFGLTGKTASAKKHTHMVWLPPEINGRIGGGRWVEVDDNGNIVGTTGASNVEAGPEPAVQAMELNVIISRPQHGAGEYKVGK